MQKLYCANLFCTEHLTGLEEKYHNALEIQHRVDITKLKKTVQEFEDIIFVYRSYILMGQHYAKVVFQRIFEAITLYRDGVAKSDIKNLMDEMEKYQEGYTNTSASNDHIVLNILAALDNDLDYVKRLTEVQDELTLSTSTKFILERTAVNIDLYFNMKDVADTGEATETYTAIYRYPDQKNPTCDQLLNNTSELHQLLDSISSYLSEQRNTSHLDMNITNGSNYIKQAIKCREFLKTRLDEMTVIKDSIKIDTFLGEFSDTVIFDFDREFKWVSDQVAGFQGILVFYLNNKNLTTGNGLTSYYYLKCFCCK